MLVITDDSTKADLEEAITNLNASAKELSRRGRIGTLTDEYRLWHERINAVLDDLDHTDGDR